MKIGKVYLVGAGPGDPDLITRKGVDCLAKADVIVYDHLLDERLMESGRPDVEKIYVGKKGAQHTLEQVDINQLLVDKAKKGKTVVRLKGGDPFVFGRGGEEAEVLVQNRVPFEIVPGVSSAIAVPAYAGISITHRGLASSFAVVTGHENPNKADSSIDWKKLATGVDTLVFLMGMENLPKIVEKLTENGRKPETPVAVVKNGTNPEQETVTATLKTIVAEVKKKRLTAPAVIVVGDVVSLRERLRWFDNRPLFGKRVLVTRARQQASALSKLLAERGARPIELPAIGIEPIPDNPRLDRAIKKLTDFDWIVFTSVNGIEPFFGRLRQLGMDCRALKGINVAVIGPATEQALEKQGVAADYCPPVYTSEGLVAGLADLDIAGKRFLLPRAEIADKDLARGIKRLGGKVTDIATYKTVPTTDSIKRVKQLLSLGQVDVITFASSSTVTNLVDAFGSEKVKLNGARVACIGPKTAATAEKAGLKVNILAEEQTIPGLVAAIEDYFTKEA